MSLFRRLNIKTLLVLSTAGLCLLMLYYKSEANAQATRAQAAETQLITHQQHLKQLQVRQQEIARLDKHHTEELRHAKQTIFQLERDVAHGRKRLRLRATCPTASDTASTRLDDAPAPRLENTAERDYFTLLRRVTLMQKQLEGLQDYVKEITEEETKP